MINPDLQSWLDKRLAKTDQRITDLETDVKELSKALSAVLTTRPEPTIQPTPMPSQPKVQRPSWSETQPPVSQRDWRPIGDGKFWMPPVGNMVPADQVPQEYVERWQREKNVPAPRAEFEEGA